MYGVWTRCSSSPRRSKPFPPRSTPPSFNPATILEETLREMNAKKKIEEAFPMLRPDDPGAGK